VVEYGFVVERCDVEDIWIWGGEERRVFWGGGGKEVEGD
jgi:hypothetical protein